MVTYTWGGGAGDWSVAADWTGGPPSPPPNGATATVQLTTSGAATIASGENFTVGGVTIGPTTLAIQGTLTVDGALTAAAGALSLTGTLALNGAGVSTIGGAFANSGALNLDAGYGDGGGALAIAGALANTGTAQVGSAYENASAATTLTLGALTNAAGASFAVYGSAAHAATLTFTGAGFTANAGTFSLFDTNALTVSGGFTNSGTFSLGGTTSVTETGAFTNSGALNLDQASSDGGGSLTIAGLLANTGTVQVGSTADTMSAATTLTLGALTNAAGASFMVNGSAAHAAKLTFTGAGFTANAGTFNLSYTNALTFGAFANSGTFGLGGTESLTETAGFTNSGALYLDTAYGDGGGSLKIAGTLANTGTVQIGSAYENASAANTLTVAALANAAGASFAVYGSAAHAATLTFTGAGFTANAGTFSLFDTNALTVSGGFTNSGTFSLGGTESLKETGAFANSGTLNLDLNSGDGGGSLTIAGLLANTGTVQVGSTADNLSAATTLTLGALTNATGATFRVNGSAAHAATLTFTGAGFTANAGTFNLSYTNALTFGAFANSGTFGLGGTESLTETAGFTNSGALYLDTAYGDGGGSLKIAGTLGNTGTVQIGSAYENASAANTLTVAALTNAAGASFAVYGSAAHAATLTFTGAGFTANAGTFSLFDTNALTLGAFTNSGTFSLGGTESLKETGAFTNSGTLNLDLNSGDGGGSLTIAGLLANTGTVQVGSTADNLSAATTLTLGALANATGATFRVNGSAAQAATLKFTGAGFTANAGTFNLSYTNALTFGAFANSGTFGLGGMESLTETAGFANSGALYLDTAYGDGGGSLKIAGTLANTGTVQIGSAYENASAANTLTVAALTNAASASFAVYGSAAHAATLTFTGAGFTANAGTFSLFDTNALTLGAFANSGTFSLGGTESLTETADFSNSGTLNLDLNSGDGGGSLTIAGLLANTGTVQVGSTADNLSAATTLTLGALTNATGATFRVNGSAAQAATLTFTGAGFTANAGTFNLSYTNALTFGAFANSGTFGLGGAELLTETADFTNSGALYLDTAYGDGGGSLTIDGTLDNTGTVQVGSGYENASAANTLTVAALANAAGASFAVYGSASHAATLTFTGAGFTANAGTFSLFDTNALTLGAFANSGTFSLGGTESLTETADFTNSGTLNLDLNSGDGGGGLTIAGLLANTGTVQVGSTADNLSAATTLTLGALTNATGASFRVNGSAAQAATLTFTGAGFTANAGTFNLSYTNALTFGAFANSGTFGLGGTESLTETADFTNSGALYLDTAYGDGGGNLTIDGTLANTGTVQVGSGYNNLSAATTLTLGGLTSASGAGFAVYGSASHAATVTVDGAVGNAGTLTLGAYSVFTVGAGGVFTQTGGTTTVGVNAAFTAATIDVDGGTFVVNATTFSNTGKLTAASGGVITLTGGLANLAGGTLTGGSYEADAGSTLQLPNNAPIVTDDAVVILSGAGSAIEDYNTATSSFSAIDQTLLTIGAGGQFQLLAGRNWTTAAAPIKNQGLIQLGGGKITSSGAGASLTDATGSRLLGFGTVTATSFSNAGTIEASGGTLTLTNAVTGSGALQIDAGANLVLASKTATTTNAANFHGAGATLTLANPTGLSGTIGGFGLADAIALAGVTANGATVNASNQLLVTENGVTVDTLKLAASYSGFTFLTQSYAGGTDVIALPVPATVADYLAQTALYDKIAGGFAVSDTAANIAAGLNVLNDTHINAITISNNSAVQVSVAQLSSDATAIGKLANQNGTPYQLTISDTAANVSNGLDALTSAHISAIKISNNAAVQVSIAQLSSDATAIGKLANLNGKPYQLAIADTAAHIAGDLDSLNVAAHISAIMISDNGAVTVSVAQLSSDATAIGKLANLNGKPYQLAVSDTAANVSKGLNGLNGAHIGAITIADNGAVTVSVAQLSSDATAIGKFANLNGTPYQLAIADTAANISKGLNALNGAHVGAITISDNGAVTVSVAQTSGDATAIGKFANQNGTPYQLAISDTATNIANGLNALNGAHIGAITIANNGAVKVSVAQLSSDATAIGKLANQNGTPYQLAIADTATNITAALATLEADVGHIASIAASPGPVTVSEATWAADQTVLDKTVGGFAVSDSLPTIVSNLGALDGDSHIASIAATSGVATLSAGVIAAPAFSISGAGTALTVSESLADKGRFSIGAGSTLSVSTGDTLTLSGTTTLAGALTGAGALVTAGGTTTLAAGASLKTAQWTIAGAGANVAVAGNAAYAGTFSAGSGDTLTLSGGNLTLSGAASLSGATIAGGAHTLTAAGTTAVSNLTIGGTTTFDNAKTLTESGGSVTLGDAAGDVASLVNASTGTWNIIDNSGIALGASPSSMIVNNGLFEKTGAGTSAIAATFDDAHSLLVSSGTLDFQGAVTGTGAATIQGAATLEFDSTLAAGQSIAFSGVGGTLDLADPAGYAGSSIGGFLKGDTVDLAGAWTVSSFQENATGTIGTLTMSNGASQVALEFAGAFSQSSFTIASGGTTIVGHS